MDTQLTDLAEARERFRQGAFAATTLRGYRYDWQVFRDWCGAVNRESLPASPDTVSLFATHLLERGNKVTSARRRVAGIVHYHRQAGHESPVPRATWRLLTAARRIRGEKRRQVKPLSLDQLRQICAALTGEEGVRDRAILTVGFASALRSATLVALRTTDLEFCEEGAILGIRHEKQDRTGAGREVGIPIGTDPATCPVRALREWLAIRPGRGDGPIFTRLDPGGRGGPMSTQAIRRIVKRSLSLIGTSPAGYGGHSMRSGLVTACGEHGVTELIIASQTGHRDMRVLRDYFRRRDLFRVNAAAMIGL